MQWLFKVVEQAANDVGSLSFSFSIDKVLESLCTPGIQVALVMVDHG